MAILLHITTHAEWAAGRAAGAYRPASLAAEGFIHCSTYDQAAATANRYFAGRADLVLLCIDEARLTAPLRYEAPPGRADQRFPSSVRATRARGCDRRGGISARPGRVVRIARGPAVTSRIYGGLQAL